MYWASSHDLRRCTAVYRVSTPNAQADFTVCVALSMLLDRCGALDIQFLMCRHPRPHHLAVCVAGRVGKWVKIAYGLPGFATTSLSFLIAVYANDFYTLLVSPGLQPTLYGKSRCLSPFLVLYYTDLVVEKTWRQTLPQGPAILSITQNQ